MTSTAMGEVSIHTGSPDSLFTGRSKMLTDDHKQLIRRILKGRMADSRIGADQRVVIRQICAELMPVAEPPVLLRAFVDALVLAADIERISYGVERDALLSQLVSVFVDELHACTGDGLPLELGLRRETPASAPRLFLDADSPETSL